jgi:RimJ/RimL family protein N-acetyltransferase
MQIRKTTIEDLQEVMEIYAHARAFMAQTGNPNQWGNSYPSEQLIREDIRRGISYVGEADGRIETVFVYFTGVDPTYNYIENGSWKNEAPYGVIHRIASRGTIKGSGSECLQWGFAQCGNLKIDTHDDNVVMQHVLEKNGFEKCGRIYLEDGRPRLAYQKTK